MHGNRAVVEFMHDPIIAAAERLVLREGGLGSRPALLVEAAYLDPRAAQGTGRKKHLLDSLGLVDWLHRMAPPAARLYLCTFKNDFAAANRMCGVPSICGVDSVSEDADDAAQLEALFERAVQNKPEDVEVLPAFTMRTTRNRVAARLKGLLRRRMPELVLRRDGQVEDLMLKTEDGEVCIGYRRLGGTQIVVRCVALMAQHYCDMYRSIADRGERPSEVWLFDFNQYMERNAVTAGAAATFQLFAWPQRLGVRIVNFVYAPANEPGRATGHVTRRPDE
jgi:hypothetical protein